MKILFLFFLLIPNHVLSFSYEKKKCRWTEKYEVHVVNSLPQNSAMLRLHCASGNDDLGYHDLSVNQDFQWSFCTRFFGTTLFFCHLWWGSKNKEFEVFNTDWQERCGNDICDWAAKSDGIYFNGEKLYDWQDN
ncbi:hypothetical protein CDL12_02808 [Handroanthus impetiginosus]|uniref:S-protein homolog n=1 Tax=Handroanthus impetiginosus TaxID=429701 RepID=A0A2G9I3V7_9LAMI|nr:hypothetical protein CDL12_02808 [Handroanthus impetiginosus]